EDSGSQSRAVDHESRAVIELVDEPSEALLAGSRFFECRLKRGFALHRSKQRVGCDVRVAEESLSHRSVQRRKRGGFVSEQRVRLGKFVRYLSVSKSLL